MLTKRATVSLLFGTSIAISGVVLLSTMNSANSGVLNFLSTILVASVVGLGSISLQPVRKFLESTDRPLDPDVLTLYLFGQAGSGKTTLIKNFFTAEELGIERSTEEFVYYDNIEVCVDVETGKRIKVHTADYKGEKPSQVIVSISPDFIGVEGDRRVNCVIFSKKSKTTFEPPVKPIRSATLPSMSSVKLRAPTWAWSGGDRLQTELKAVDERLESIQ